MRSAKTTGISVGKGFSPHNYSFTPFPGLLTGSSRTVAGRSDGKTAAQRVFES
jgi:hypothetical protein